MNSERLTLAVVIIVGLTLLGGLAGIIGLSLADPARSIPDVLQNVTIGALTLLGGILIPRPSSRETETRPEPVV